MDAVESELTELGIDSAKSCNVKSEKKSLRCQSIAGSTRGTISLRLLCTPFSPSTSGLVGRSARVEVVC